MPCGWQKAIPHGHELIIRSGNTGSKKTCELNLVDNTCFKTEVEIVIFKWAFLDSGTWIPTHSCYESQLSFLLWVKSSCSLSSSPTPPSSCSKKKRMVTFLTLKFSTNSSSILKEGDHFLGESLSVEWPAEQSCSRNCFLVSMGETQEDFGRNRQSWISLQTRILWHKFWSSCFLGTPPVWGWSHLI